MFWFGIQTMTGVKCVHKGQTKCNNDVTRKSNTPNLIHPLHIIKSYKISAIKIIILPQRNQHFPNRLIITLPHKPTTLITHFVLPRSTSAKKKVNFSINGNQQVLLPSKEKKYKGKFYHFGNSRTEKIPLTEHSTRSE